MHAGPLYALIPIAAFQGTTLLALALTAAILIPAGFWFGFLRDQVAAKTFKKTN